MKGWAFVGWTFSLLLRTRFVADYAWSLANLLIPVISLYSLYIKGQKSFINTYR